MGEGDGDAVRGAGALMLPQCPTCRTKLSPERMLQARGEDIPMSPMTESTWEFFVVSVSCPGCLAMIEVDDFGGGWAAKETISSSAVTRVRDRLEGARREDVLEREVRALFSNPTTALLLGTPELFEFVTQGLGKTVVLAEQQTAWPGGGRSPGKGFPEEAWTLRPADKWPPPADSSGPDRPFLVPGGTKLSVIGVRERALLCHHAWHPLLVHPDGVTRG